MISHIRIKDFAIIDTVDLDFHDGLNIITGETGAGKSIMIEAVSLALGSRADTAFIRSGKDKAVVQMLADLDGEEFVVTRELSAAGKNVCKLNGEIVSLSQLNQLCRRIADVHGQYDHQSLLNPENHLKLIDSFHDREISPARERVSDLFHKYSETKHELVSLLSSQADAERKRDFMRFELSEINGVKPYPGEDDELSQKLSLLQNSEKIYQNLSGAYGLLYETSPSAADGIGKSLRLLQEISGFSDEINGFCVELSDAYYKIEDQTTAIRKFKDGISFSPEILEETVNRLNVLDSLKRKYGGSIEKVLEYKERISLDLEKIENIDALRDKLSKELSAYEKELAEACAELTGLRRKSAADVEAHINEELKELNFKDTVLTVAFYDEDGGKLNFSANGVDRIEFLITTNKGEAPKPLAKIASGGEISRIMLAFKQIIAGYDRIPTMIFDEIDAGISGITASIVGKKLSDISKQRQIICITHLPQIAAFGDHHYRIEKAAVGEITLTTVSPLDEQEKIKEIARLLGGINITETTLKSAEELIKMSR
ncbi:MAG TPA: DNA repair protein RecN [Anaerovoracaceae bacterium]|nr:DNA repair protein RecN [Anaerovoracaceae bacterium]